MLATALIMAQSIACGGSVDSGPGGTGNNGSGGGGSQGSGGEGGAGGGSASSSCECIAAYGGDALDGAALIKLRDQGLSACFHTMDPATLDMERSCLPFIVGKHAGDGKDIDIYYFCSDVCPNYGHVGIRYAGIEDAPACCAIGGVPLLDPAWGGFEACVPKEIDPQVPWTAKCPP